MSRQRQLPADADQRYHAPQSRPAEAALLTALLAHDPKRRPAIDDVLRSGLLPLPDSMRAAPARTVVERVFHLLNHITMGSRGGWPPTPDRPGYATTPMLFIAGGSDPGVPADEILRLARPYPRAETLVVPGATHMRAMWADQEKYTSTVLEFLDRCLSRTETVS